MTCHRSVRLDPLDVLSIHALIQIGEQLIEGEPWLIVPIRQIDVRRDADTLDVLARGAEVGLDELKLSQRGVRLRRPSAHDWPDSSTLGAENLIEYQSVRCGS